MTTGRINQITVLIEGHQTPPTLFNKKRKAAPATHKELPTQDGSHAQSSVFQCGTINIVLMVYTIALHLLVRGSCETHTNRPECQWPTHKFFLESNDQQGETLQDHRRDKIQALPVSQWTRKLELDSRRRCPWDATLWCRVQIRLTDLKPPTERLGRLSKGGAAAAAPTGFLKTL